MPKDIWTLFELSTSHNNTPSIFVWRIIINFNPSQISTPNPSQPILIIFCMIMLGFVYFGAVAKVAIVGDMGDVTMGVMAFIDIIVIVLLPKYVFAVVKDYNKQLKAGISESIFKLDNHANFKDKVKSDIW